MRTLTFEGFLREYVKKLSEANTQNMEILAKEAANGNYRLQAPLVLYALTSGKENLLLSQLRKENAYDIIKMLNALSDKELEQELEKGAVPDEYQKAWNSYQVARDEPRRENDLKNAMRNKIISLQQEKKCTNYRIYTDLQLNPGNINSWLKNGDSRKVSYDSAERVMRYLLQYESKLEKTE